jgi:hypothetical protein
MFMSPRPAPTGVLSPSRASTKSCWGRQTLTSGVRFHDLRHIPSPLSPCRAAVDAKTLASMLGHYSAGFTLDTYTHVNPTRCSRARRINRGFMEGVTMSTTGPEPPAPSPGSSGNKCKIIPSLKRCRKNQQGRCKNCASLAVLGKNYWS